MSAKSRLQTLAIPGLGLLLLTGCAGSLQESLQADPLLQDRPVFDGEAAEIAPEPEPEPTDLPDEPPSAAADPAPEEAPGVGDGNPLLGDVPEDLRPYVQDWLALGIGPKATDGTLPTMAFQPNQPITRGEFAQWLLSANNQFYQDVPAQRIRPATSTTTPAFQDVPGSHPYFAAIQGLAEAGIIPSAKTGNATAVTFRPDAPLTREVLVLWKVPLDTRAPLPAATAAAVTEVWGFQDVAQVEPLALRAVLADHQQGDFANIRRAFGFTTLLQPQKGVSQAEAAAALWRFGTQTEGVSAADLLSRPDPEVSRPAPEATPAP